MVKLVTDQIGWWTSVPISDVELTLEVVVVGVPNGLTEKQIGANNLHWEVAKKYNLVSTSNFSMIK